VSPRIHFIIDSRRESVPLFLKRPGDRAPGGRRPARALRAGLRARLGDRRREVRGSARTHLLSLSRRVANRDQPCAGVGSKPTGPVKSFEKFCAQEAAEMASTQPHEQNLGRAPARPQIKNISGVLPEKAKLVHAEPRPCAPPARGLAPATRRRACLTAAAIHYCKRLLSDHVPC
jgi:hypothetical protein